MAAASSSSVVSSTSSFLVPPVSLVVSDQELLDDGSLVVSSCVLHKFFEFYEVSRVRRAFRDQYPAGRFLPVTAPTLRHVIDNFPYMSRGHYATIAGAHFVSIRTSDRKDHLRDLLRVHVCDTRCVNNLVVFQLLKTPRRYFAHEMMPDPFSVLFKPASRNRATRSKHIVMTDGETPQAKQRRQTCVTHDAPDDCDGAFPILLSFDDKKSIIAEWQQQMSQTSLRRSPCACCAHNVPATELVLVDIQKVPLHLLRNDCLPEHTLPQTYAFELYERAILYPKGLQDLWAKSDIYLCRTCRSALVSKSPRQPVNSLANFQYYAHERLPPLIRSAFLEASVYDLMLVSRARASQIVHHYAYKPSSGSHWTAEEASQ
ncbi:uncharacterized protein F5891DRAFT_1201130 [Suillus fuscotomentosus]|uniref:Uncharacterized protein n=1 Tax=Suillus fuscotomentosus TaxID=1912939 RepID=A0AAD4HCD8_9AGAM|nr:uncharacterized protein F5891DRAFT_1201130 [Suillus fuscotomentosus]KAG1886345.1 hypothetical protein F5891DRAFT_1201130 [Suillus fuscotomentosus]